MANREHDELLAAIRRLPESERRALLDQAARDLAAVPSDPLGFIGMYADESELIDAICEDAMRARERDPLRVASG